MNMAEALSREIERVTVIRERYRDLHGQPGIDVAPSLFLLDAAIEGGHRAAGSNDALEVIRTHANLQGFTE